MRRIPLIAVSSLWVLAAAVAACNSDSQQTTSSSASSTSSSGVGGSSSGAGGTGGGGGATSSASSSSSSSTSGFCANLGAPSSSYPAARPKDPTVISQGGPVLDKPKVVPIYFAGDDTSFTAKLTDFVQKLVASSYWAATTSEYGVGAATAGTPIQLKESAPSSLTDMQIQQWLTTKLQSDPSFPMPDGNTIYTIFYPSGTTVLQDTGMGTAQSCKEFGGYHSNFKVGGQEVPYAVLPRCNYGGGLLETTTGSTSHELVEAATDPFPMTQAAWSQPDGAHLYYLYLFGGGEVGDMCAQNPTAFGDFAGIGYTVQRTWSNAASKAGHDPCQPTINTYGAAVPVLPDTFNVQGVAVKGVGVPAAGRTIDVVFYSDADPGGPMPVQAVDASKFLAPGQLDTLDLSLDCDHAQNGQRLHLTIKTVQQGAAKAGGFFLVTGNQVSIVAGLTVAK